MSWSPLNSLGQATKRYARVCTHRNSGASGRPPASSFTVGLGLPGQTDEKGNRTINGQRGEAAAATAAALATIRPIKSGLVDYNER